MRALDLLITDTGATPAIWSLWSHWGSRAGHKGCLAGQGSCAFPSAAAKELGKRGITPLIWWLPLDPRRWEKGRFERYRLILAGDHDAYIRRWARAARDFGYPVLLRFAHEMNGHWYPYGLGRFDNNPGLFKKAWRHIWRLFRDEGASNVRFVWSPMPEGCLGCRPDYRFERFYPGSRFVDYVSVTAFNWGRSSWESLVHILDKPLRRLRQVTRTKAHPGGKAVIVAELASGHVGGSKAAWIRRGYRRVYARWPKVRGMVYFDVDMRQQGHPDWRLIKPIDGSALAAYSRIASNPRFRGSLR